MHKLFPYLYRYFKDRKLVFFFLLTALFAVSAYYAVQIELEEDISNFMPNTPQTERTNFVLKNISTNDKIILKFSCDGFAPADAGLQDYLVACADSLVDSLQAAIPPGYIKDVLYKIDESVITTTGDFVMANLPLFLAEADYRRLDTVLSPRKIAEIMEQNKRDIVSPTGFVFKKFIVADPLHISGNIFTDIGKNAVDSLYNMYEGHIFSKDNRQLFVFVTSAHGIGETGKNEVLARVLENQVANIMQRNGGKLRVTSFGAALVGVSNAAQIKQDSMVSSGISVILVLLLLGLFFRSFRSLVLLLVPVAFGVLFSLALLYFFKGTISAIALGAGSAIFGIAINYTLHFLVHNKHSVSVERTIKDLVSPLLVGSVTTIGAFLSLMFVSAGALKDFGIFAALALFGTILFVLVFMPHFMKDSGTGSQRQQAFFDRLSEIRLDKGWIILCVLVLTLVFGYFSCHVGFESDMNKLSYMTPGQKHAFEELSNFTNIAQKSIIHVSEGRDIEEALRTYEQSKPQVDSLMLAGDINSVSGIGSMLMSDSAQRARIGQWHEFWSSRKDSVRLSVTRSSEASGFRAGSFDQFLHSLDSTFQPRSQRELLAVAPFAAPYIIEKPGRSIVITLLYVNPQKEAHVKAVLGSQRGVFVFDRASANRDIINVLSDDFNSVLMICACLVLLFITMSFGRFELSLLTFVPMVVGWVWILGLMAIFGVKFNIVNIILATFIFGLGDDYSIFIMEGSIHEYTFKRKILGSYKLAVILSALTMFIGIGSLVFARHPAMQSLAQVTIIGMFSVVVVSYTVLPFTYRWLTTTGGHRRLIPVTARNLGNSLWAFSVFFVGTCILKLVGFFLFRFNTSSDSKKLLFHRSLVFVAHFVIKHLPRVKTRVRYLGNEDFSKPAVIMCNHQSHLDLMLIMMLSPRVIILTNQWVWDSPFIGKIVKYADFYPVSEGAENSIEPLSRLVEKGYSIMVFPEGTRSEDCSINRFHRGAFFLAEQLHLDIIPIVLHGVGHVLPKTDFMLRKGQMCVDVLPRIVAGDTSFGDTNAQRAKNVRIMYKEHYSRMALEIETPDYFADKVFHNYIYKGAAAGIQTAISLRKHGNYRSLIDCLPRSGRVLVLGSGYGSFPMMLSLVRPSLIIDSVEADAEKIALASNCVASSARITFIEASPLEFCSQERYDAVVCLDLFHTFDNQQQQALLEKYVDHTCTVIISDVRYSVIEKLRIVLSGGSVPRSSGAGDSSWRQLSSHFNYLITQKDNIFAVSRS